MNDCLTAKRQRLSILFDFFIRKANVRHLLLWIHGDNAERAVDLNTANLARGTRSRASQIVRSCLLRCSPVNEWTERITMSRSPEKLWPISFEVASDVPLFTHKTPHGMAYARITALLQSHPTRA